MAKNGFLPAFFAVVSGRAGIPRRALVINFFLGVAFLQPFGSWQKIVAATSILGLIAYALPSVSAVVFERGSAFPGGAPRWVKYLAPVAFVLASLIIYWAGWTTLRIALPILLVGMLVYFYQHLRARAPWSDAALGAWWWCTWG